MKVLHILRAEPDEVTRKLISGISRSSESKEVALYNGSVNYDRLLDDIFASDKVICWWASKAAAPVSRR